MKKRQGFVSNSSSSSFLLRGVKFKESDLNEILGTEIKDDAWEFGEVLKTKGVKLDTESNCFYFDGEPTGEVLVGKSLPSPEDGEVAEISDGSEMDEKIIKELAKIGITDIKFGTFFQYVSNDNY